MRCQQLGLPLDTDDDLTTLSRASNVRELHQPPLPAGYCGNAVLDVRTSMSVRALLTSSVAHVASALRASLSEQSAEAVVRRQAEWLHEVHAKGYVARRRFDRKALTFVVSSWRCAWEDAVFAAGGGGGAAAAVDVDGEARRWATPVAFDHGALVPIVAVFTARPRASGGGINVYASGPRASLEGVFVKRMVEGRDGAGGRGGGRARERGIVERASENTR